MTLHDVTFGRHIGALSGALLHLLISRVLLDIMTSLWCSIITNMLYHIVGFGQEGSQENQPGTPTDQGPQGGWVRQDQMVPKVDGVHLVPIKDQVVGVLHQMGVGDRQAQWTDGDQDQEMGGDHLKEIDSVDPVEEEDGGDQGNSLV